MILFKILHIRQNTSEVEIIYVTDLDLIEVI